MATADATPPLLAFCRFLQQRLATENLELLTRIVHEFLRTPRAFETVDSMVEMTFPMVTILPLVHSDVDSQQRARQLRMRMRKQPQANSAFRDLYEALASKVELTNWDWLQQIYDEFCIGKERTLVAFVTQSGRAISTIPVRPLGLESTECPVSVCPDHELLDDKACVAAVKQEDAKANILNAQSLSIEARTCPSKNELQNRELLLVEFNAIESQAPWTKLATTTIELPFNAPNASQLVHRLQCFWDKHVRAVWERNFWFRYPRDGAVYQQLTDERAKRQDNALASFEHTVLLPLYNAFGAAFFVALDARRKRTPWWWYREPIVDIVRLCDRDGLDTSVAYVRSQALKRFPRTPTGCSVRCDKHFGDGRSMWSVRDKYQYITDEIDALKHVTDP